VGGQAGLWWGVARLGYRRYSAYRAATLGGLFTNTVFGFMRSYVLLAVLREAGPIGGYDATDAVTYVWLTQGLMNIVALWGWDLISARVRTGEIASDLTRPVDFQAWWLAHDLGRAWYHSVTRAVVPLAVGLMFFDIRLPGSIGQVTAFLVSVVLAVGVSFAMRFIVELSAFWWLDANGARITYGLLQNFLSGFTVPLAFIPGAVGALVGVLPFAASMQIPIDVFLGNHRGPAQLSALGLQVFWLVTLLVVGRLVFAAATRRLVLQGG
jgi:ABC-2 type transport system permease protein